MTSLRKKVKKELCIKTIKKFSILKYYKEEIEFIVEFIKEKNIDTIVLSQGALSSISVILKKKFPNLKIIVWQHSEATVYFNNYNKFFLEEYIKGIECADSLVCLTHKDYEIFSKYNNNCKQIYNPVNLYPRKITNLDNLNICFAGRMIVESKGLDIIVKSMKYFDNHIKLSIAGNSTKKELRKLKKIIKNENMEHRVKLIGPLRTEQMAQFYYNSDVYVSASKWEGFGLTVVEAMQCGLPIIAFNNSGPKEILSNGKYGIIVEERTPERLADEIGKLLMNKYELEKYQKLSLDRSKDFSIEKIGLEWSKILK